MNDVQITDNYLGRMADKKYKESLADWEKQLATEQDRNMDLLGDPGYAKSIGLPEKLPQHTIDILKVTMALDKLGPSKPQADVIYKQFGL